MLYLSSKKCIFNLIKSFFAKDIEAKDKLSAIDIMSFQNQIELFS